MLDWNHPMRRWKVPTETPYDEPDAEAGDELPDALPPDASTEEDEQEGWEPMAIPEGTDGDQ